jgi:hypothetical protein
MIYQEEKVASVQFIRLLRWLILCIEDAVTQDVLLVYGMANQVSPSPIVPNTAVQA